MEYLKRAAVVIMVLVLAACVNHHGMNHYKQPCKNPPNCKIPSTSPKTQQVAALAFISYAGESIEAPDYISNQVIESCLSDELSRHEILNNQYELAWGPLVYRFKHAKLDDNMMYAVWNKANSGELIIAIRGTNGASISDWIDEDFRVTRTVPWSVASSRTTDACSDFNAIENPVMHQSSGAQISQATDIGLNVLQCLGTSTSAKTTLYDFIAAQAKAETLTSIVVTGHSLAGALSPVYALWLKDNQTNWDPDASNQNAVPISVLPIAGATPGNADFADYYKTQLGATTNRLHNPYDVVPQAWYIPSMKEIKNLYATSISDYRPDLIERIAFGLGIRLAKGKNYSQIMPDQNPTWGAINTKQPGFVDQAKWQHHCGYYNALGLNMVNGLKMPMKKVNAYCVTEQFCIDNKGSPMCDFVDASLCPDVPLKPLKHGTASAQ